MNQEEPIVTSIKDIRYGITVNVYNNNTKITRFHICLNTENGLIKCHGKTIFSSNFISYSSFLFSIITSICAL